MKQQTAPTQESNKITAFFKAHKKAIIIALVVITLFSAITTFLTPEDQTYGNGYKPGYVIVTLASSSKDKQKLSSSDMTLDSTGDFSSQYNAPANDAFSAILDDLIEGAKNIQCRMVNTADECEELFAPQPILITVTSAIPTGKTAGTYDCDPALLQLVADQIPADTKKVRPLVCTLTYKD